MIKFADINGFHFVGKFNELIVELAAIENKDITLREYLEKYRKTLN